VGSIPTFRTNIMKGNAMQQKEVKVTNTGGIGFVGLLTIVFITLKLTGYINWSWLWVLSPIWIAMIFWVFFIFVFTGIVLIATRKK
jgi:hypothetical protein